MKTKDSLVEQYVKNGFHLFPTANKIPINYGTTKARGWTQTAFDPLLVGSELPPQFAVCLQTDDLVLDVDIRRYVDNVNQLEALWQKLDLGNRLSNFIVQTQGEGCHIYFKKPIDVAVRSIVPGFPAVEIKTKGKYVIGAGSPGYEVINGIFSNISECPAALLDYIRANAVPTNRKDVLRQIREYQIDDDTTVQRFIRFIASHAPIHSGEGGDLATLKVASEAKDYGLSEDTCFDLMWHYLNPKCFRDGQNNSWTSEKLRIKVANAYAYCRHYEQGSASASYDFSKDADDSQRDGYGNTIQTERSTSSTLAEDFGFQTTEKGSIKLTLANATAFFQNNTDKNPLYRLVRYNQFSGQHEFMRQAIWHKSKADIWMDSDTTFVKHHFSNKWQLEFSDVVCRQAMQIASRGLAYHPIKQWIEAIIWDGVPRLDNLLPKYAGTDDTNYARMIGKCTIIAAVARIYDPGCKHDAMLIKEGEQGTFKSTFVQVLGGKWYGTTKMDVDRSQDYVRTVCAMQKSWIIEAGELDFMKRSEVTAIKDFLSIQEDYVRKAYGFFEESLKRKSIFIGTINPDFTGEYLRDTTGNRRFWVIRTNKIDIGALQNDRDQIFAEALHRYRNGEQWHLDEQTELEAKEQQSQRMIREPWAHDIAKWLKEYQLEGESLTTALVATNALGLAGARLTHNDSLKVGNALKELGYVCKQIRKDGERVRTWVLDTVPQDVGQ